MLGLDAAGKTSMLLSPLYPTVILQASGASCASIRMTGHGRGNLLDVGETKGRAQWRSISQMAIAPLLHSVHNVPYVLAIIILPASS